ncbi:hypothetical protein ACFO0N_09120 [Halobium salinum]|uniref:Uncharacterized protein n=1 Tax=Halobium salinum TaxID=1364940 RepID=A0ABD5PBS4_9EURY|nr:hypothetical protein [Halobium salinum]
MSENDREGRSDGSGTDEGAGTDRSVDTGDAHAEATRWVLQWSEPFGENQPKRVVDTEAAAEAVVEAWQDRYESVEGEPGLYRVELNAEVYFTTVEVPYGPLPDEE